VLVRSLSSGDFRLPHTGLTLYGEGVDKVPAAAITPEDADLLARLSKQGPVTMRLTLTPKTLPPVSSYNIIADWKGSEHTEEVVLVSGHLDSWDLGTGAIDDGAGGGYFNADDPFVAVTEHPSETHNPFCRLDE